MIQLPMTTSKKNKRNRRTDAEREKQLAFAKKLLDMNVPSYAVALQMQSRFELTRSTAWRDVKHANDERGSAEEGGIHATQSMMDMRDTLINILYQNVLNAAVEEDTKTLPRLTKEIRELMKMGGPGVGRHPDDGPVEEEALLSQIQYLYNERMKKEEATK